MKAFKDGKVVAEFIGAIPPARIEAFLNEIVPSEADRLAESGDEESLRRALELDPRHAQAAIGLGRMLLGRGEAEEAPQLLRNFPHDFVADGLAARAELVGDRGTARVPTSSRPLRCLGRRRSRARRSSGCSPSSAPSRTPSARTCSAE